jgi:uncharacterized protein DUF6916
MSSSRRKFLKQGTLMALAAGVPWSLTEKASGMGTSTSKTAGLTFASFKSQRGTTFFIHHGTGKLKATLVDITSFASRQQTAAGKEGFTLLFRGPQDTTLKQDTFLIEHDQLGLFSFLIVPVRTRDTRAPHYAAVINRLHS